MARLVINPEALTEIRSRVGTKADVARLAGISRQYLCDLEAGRRKGTNPTIIRALAVALGCAVTDITADEVAA